MIVIRTVIMLAGVTLACAMLWLVYSFHAYGVPTNPTDLKEFVEKNGLNLIGDALAGFLSLVTLLVVIASFAQQSAQAKQAVKDMEKQNDVAKQTVKEMKDQNDVAKAVARANYKFALFDKRLAVYDELNELTVEVTTGQLKKNFHRRALKAINSAKNLFGDDNQIIEWVNDMSVKTQMHREVVTRVKKLEYQLESGENQYAESSLLVATNEAPQVYKEMSDVFDWNKLDHWLLPYLRLDSNIKLTDRDEVDQLIKSAT